MRVGQHFVSPQLSLMQYTYNNVCTVKSSFHFCGVSRCCGYTGSTEGASKGYLSGKGMLCGSARAHVCMCCVCVCARVVSANLS